MFFTRLCLMGIILALGSNTYSMNNGQGNFTFRAADIVGPIHRESNDEMVVYGTHLQDGSRVICANSDEDGINCKRETTDNNGRVWETFLLPSNYHTLVRLYQEQQRRAQQNNH